MDENADDDEVELIPQARQASDYRMIDAWFDSLRDEPDSIEIDGIVKLSDALGIDPENDPVILVLAKYMDAKKMLHFSREEFRKGMTELGCDSTASLKAKLPQLRETLNNKRQFKELYLFLYSYALDAGQRILTKDMAMGLWKLLFHDKFALFPKWMEYFEKYHKHGVSKDMWSQFLAFTELPGLAEGHYEAIDKIDAWPTLLDEFVAYLKSTK